MNPLSPHRSPWAQLAHGTRLPSMIALAALSLALVLVSASPAAAQDDGPSAFGYGMHGLWTGAELGLATGFLTTGPHYESGEWRKLAFGAGIGAIAGVGLGLSLGIADAGGNSSSGWYVLRDMGYGTTLGALTGTAVGALFLLNDGQPKDLLTGACYGALIGAGSGVVIGLLEGSSSHGRAELDRPGVRFALLNDEHSIVPVPGVAGSF